MRITSKNKRLQRIVTLVLIAILLAPLIVANHAFATTITMDGGLTLTDTQNTIKNSSGTVTATAKGNLFAKKTNTITITNDSGNQAQLSFDYSVASASSFTIDGSSGADSGTFKKVLEAGASVEIVITSNQGLSNTTVTLTLTNIALKATSTGVKVTINYDSKLGSVTAAGNAIGDGGSIENVTTVDGVALVAAPATGATFLGWVDAADGKIFSVATSFTLTPTEAVTVNAVFVGSGSNPWFGVGLAAQTSESVGLLGMSKLYYYTVPSIAYLFDDLNAAATAAAASSSSKVVVLMNSGTLSAGDYTIPAGVTLLIPFDSENTLYTTSAQAEKIEKINNVPQYPPVTEYRTLTMASGANLTINGSLSLSAKTSCAHGSLLNGGSPQGPTSFIRMNTGSSIVVNSGGALYAYGFITGNGQVEIKSGGTVYECFQIMDFRGGTQSTDMDNGVFPLSQYYVQNIEVRMKIHSGATEYAYTTIVMSDSEFGSAVKFISDKGAMFNMTSGYAIKRYDGATDRLIIELNGTANLSSIEIKVSTSSINSKDYDLALNSNITVEVKSGSNAGISQDLVLLPGSEVIIEEGATVTLGNNTSIYAYDADQWGKFCAPGNKTFIPVTYAPGKTYTRTDADLVDAKVVVNGTLDASAGYLYTTAGGANICSTGNGVVQTKAGEQTVTHQLVQNTGYTEIPITPAKLKNGDGSYLHTNANTAATTYTYCADCQKWQTIVSYYASNVELGNNLNLYFAFMRDEITDSSGHYVKINGGNAIYYDDWQGYDSNDDEVDDYFVVIYEGLAAKQMCDAVSVTLYDKDGNMIDAWCDSIRNYAMRLLASADETYTLLDANNDGEVDNPDNQTMFTGILNLRKLLVDMLNYGAACQTYFGYNTSDLANSQLTDAQKTYASTEVDWTDDSQMPSGSTNYPANLVTKSNIRFAIDGVTASASYSFIDHWGDQQTGSFVYQAAAGNDPAYYYIDKLTVADARQEITITIDGVSPWTDSIEAYCKRMIDDEAAEAYVYEAFMKFSDSAKAYLEGEGRLK